MRLLELPLEYWELSAIMAVAGEACNPLSLNNFTDSMRKTGFARVRMEIDTSKLLLPGVLIQGRNTVFWQQFVYENLPPMYFHCGRMGHTIDDCKFWEDNLSNNSRTSGLCPKNFVAEHGKVVDLKQGSNGPGPKPSGEGGNSPLVHGLSLQGSANHARWESL